MGLVNDGHPFRLETACDVGLRPFQIRHALRSGELRRVFTGVAVDGRAPDTPELRLRALAQVVPPHALVADHTAAWGYGVDTRPPHMLHDDRPMIVVPHGRARPVNSRAIVRQSTVPDADTVEILGLRMTSPLRTAGDLLRLAWRPHALAAADAMVRARVVAVDEVGELVATFRRLPGTLQAQELAPRIDAAAQKHGESWMRCRIMDAGLPRPTLQHEVVLRDGRWKYLDAAWPEKRAASEYDGREHHTADPDVEHDRARREEVTEQLYWTFAVARYERIFGTDDSFERELGETLKVQVRPRRW